MHTSKERGNDFYKWMNDVTRTTSKIGPILSPDGKLKATDNEMAPEFNDYLCDLMTPSTIHRFDWDVKHKPKERRLQVANIPGVFTQNPMESSITRQYIIALHNELKMHGFELKSTDIENSCPLGVQARGQSSLPIVITYKDTETAEAVKQAAKKAGLWKKRKQQTNKIIETAERSWIKRATSWLKGVFLPILKGNKNDKITERKGFFTDPNDTLNTIYTTTEIMKAIRKSKRKSAAGPDGLRMSVYSEACENLLEPLQILFNTINSTGIIPENFKRARVILLYKKKSKQNMANYRPISMSNHISKIWEPETNRETSGFDPLLITVLFQIRT